MGPLMANWSVFIAINIYKNMNLSAIILGKLGWHWRVQTWRRVKWGRGINFSGKNSDSILTRIQLFSPIGSLVNDLTFAYLGCLLIP